MLAKERFKKQRRSHKMDEFSKALSSYLCKTWQISNNSVLELQMANMYFDGLILNFQEGLGEQDIIQLKCLAIVEDMDFVLHRPGKPVQIISCERTSDTPRNKYPMPHIYWDTDSGLFSKMKLLYG